MPCLAWLSFSFLSLCLLGSGLLHASRESGTFSALTYNVLAERDEHHEQRIQAVLDLLEEADADIIALQEVETHFLKALFEREKMAAYQAPALNGKILVPRGLLILSKQPIDNIDYGILPGKQRRAWLIINTTIAGTPYRVATCHLESFLEDGPIRAVQLEQFFQKLEDSQHTLFLGDFNFGDGEPESKEIPNDYRDAWLSMHPTKAGYTWNMEESLMAKRGAFPGEKSRRLDRILLRSDSTRIKAAQLLGNTPINQQLGLYPSDHFGVIAHFTMPSARN